jgi:hypothetical protein
MIPAAQVAEILGLKSIVIGMAFIRRSQYFKGLASVFQENLLGPREHFLV